MSKDHRGRQKANVRPRAEDDDTHVRQDAERYLQSWREDKERIVADAEGFTSWFERRLHRRWEQAFEEYELVLYVALQMWNQFNGSWFRAAMSVQDHKTLSLIDLYSRSCRIAREVLVLLRAGFPSAAAARARTMHEIAVVGFFIREQEPEIARRYREHGLVEKRKRMAEYNATLVQTHDYEPHAQEEIDAVEHAYRELITRYSKEFSKAHGWAAPAFSGKAPSFRDIEGFQNMGHLRPYYQWYSQDVHPGAHGNELNYLKRGDEKRVLLAGPTNGGLTDPAVSAMLSLGQAATFCYLPLPERDYPENISCPLEQIITQHHAQLYALEDLIANAEQVFVEVQRQLDKDEHAAMNEAVRDLDEENK